MYTEKNKNLINDFISNKFEIDKSLLTPEANFKSDISIDSLDVIDIIFFIESHFKVKIKIDDLKSLSNLEDLYRLADQQELNAK